MPTPRLRWFVLLALLGIMLTGTTSLAQAAPSSQGAAPGEQTYKTKCAACHTIGGGKLVGPDLKGVAARRDAGWLKSFIAAPDKLLASGDPIAAQLLKDNNNIPMPNLGLTAREVDDLLAFLAAGNAGGAAATTGSGAATGSTAPAAGDTAAVLALHGSADAGEQIFAQVGGLQAGGTSCIACHSVEGIGGLGGGALGPDLTHVHARYGRQGLAAALGSLPFPTMQSIFASRQLTPNEQADLLAFFARADQQGEPRTQRNLLLILVAGLGLCVALLLGMTFFWPRQRLSISQRLRKNGKL